MVSGRLRQQGSMLGEVLLLLMVLLILGTQAGPALFKIYRQAAVEYEAEHLLADMRRCQSLSRVTGSSAWNYGAQSSADNYVHLLLSPDKSILLAGNTKIIASHVYWAGIRTVKVDDKSYTTKVDIAFAPEGTPRSVEAMMTILIYYQGYEQEGRRIMLSKGGRIRMERGRSEG